MIMSERQQIQNELHEFITSQARDSRGRPVFNAPYGVIEGLKDVSSGGKVRTITFGICRTLDATLFIWSPNKIDIVAAGPLGHVINGKYTDVVEVKEALKSIYE